MKLFLIRHGRPEVFNGDYFGSGLEIQGISETEDFASSGILPKPDLIFSSPYNRAIGTAKVISEQFSMTFQVMDFLREWNLQSLNLQEEYAEQEQLGWNDHNKVVLGNESLNQVKERISKGIKELTNKYASAKTIFLVAHGTVIDMFCSEISGRKVKNSDIKGMKHLDYAVVEFNNDKFQLIKDIINNSLETDLTKLKEKIREFNLERDWDKFHNPKDLVIALMSEVGELAECYRWLNDDELLRIHSDPVKKKKVEEEIADIMMYLIILAYKNDIDIFQAIEQKLEKNKRKYPVDKSKGIHSNPIEGYKGKE